MFIEQRSTASRSFIRKQLGDVAEDEHIDGLLTEISRRELNAPATYPFTLVDSVIHFHAGHAMVGAYGYLLIAAFPGSPFRLARRFASAERGLDVLTEHALRGLLSGEAQSIRFAWPPGKGDGRRPGRFPDAVVWLAENLGLTPLNPNPNPKRKDGGVDVVAWRPFRDGRSAFPVVLAQTTIQASFMNKAGDIWSKLWSNWISFGVEPTTALVVPHVIPMAETWWDDMRFAVNLIVDRIRLLELLEHTDVAADPALAEMGEWVDGQLLAMAL